MLIKSIKQPLPRGSTLTERYCSFVIVLIVSSCLDNAVLQGRIIDDSNVEYHYEEWIMYVLDKQKTKRRGFFSMWIILFHECTKRCNNLITVNSAKFYANFINNWLGGFACMTCLNIWTYQRCNLSLFDLFINSSIFK